MIFPRRFSVVAAYQILLAVALMVPACCAFALHGNVPFRPRPACNTFVGTFGSNKLLPLGYWGGSKLFLRERQNSIQLNMNRDNLQRDTIQQEREQQQILEAVLALPQMKDKTLLHLSIVGSRSKQLANEDADYDVKAIVLHSHEDYLLQNITPSQSFETTILVNSSSGKEVEVEGTLVDYLTMQKYVLGTGLSAYEAFQGLVVYKTPASDYLQQLFRKAYNPDALVLAYQGLGRSEVGRAEKKKRKEEIQEGGYSIKHAANMVYYASAVLAIHKNSKEMIRCHGAVALLDSLEDDEAIPKDAIRALYRQRRQAINQSAVYVDTEPFSSFLERAQQVEVSKKAKSYNEEQRVLRQEANREFLKMIS